MAVTKLDLAKQATAFADVDVNTNKIINVVDPTADQDAATKKYVDDQGNHSHSRKELSSQADGTNTDFTLDDTQILGTINVTLNGVDQTPTNDFTEIDGTVTFTTAPDGTDTVVVYYQIGTFGSGGTAADHGLLIGLADDDHSQYALLAGRTNGQILIGGLGTTDSLTLRATAGAGDSTSNLIFEVGTDGTTEAMRILKSGNVGIGTANPDSILHLDDGTSTDLIIEKDDAGLARVVFHNDGIEGANINFNAFESLIIENKTASDGSTTDGDIVFRINNDATATDVMRVLASQARVGIGSASPLAKLNIVSSDNVGMIFEQTDVDSTANRGGVGYAGARKDIATTPFSAYATFDNGINRGCFIGGSDWGLPDATIIQFYTAPTYDETANSGVLRGQVGPAGDWKFSKDTTGATTADGILHIDNDTANTDLVIEKDATTQARVVFHNSGSELGNISMDDAEDIIIENDEVNRNIVFKVSDGTSDVTVMTIDGDLSNVGIGTTTTNTSAKLEIDSTTGALLVSRMTTADSTNMTPVNGMIIYNTTTNAFNFRENGAWVTGSGLI